MSSKEPFRRPRKVTKKNPDSNNSFKVVVSDDSVNLVNYMIFAFGKIFGYSKEKIEQHLDEMKQHGLSVVWTGYKEKAELYVYELQEWQINAYLKRDE